MLETQPLSDPRKTEEIQLRVSAATLRDRLVNLLQGEKSLSNEQKEILAKGLSELFTFYGEESGIQDIGIQVNEARGNPHILELTFECASQDHEILLQLLRDSLARSGEFIPSLDELNTTEKIVGQFPKKDIEQWLLSEAEKFFDVKNLPTSDKPEAVKRKKRITTIRAALVCVLSILLLREGVDLVSEPTFTNFFEFNDARDTVPDVELLPISDEQERVLYNLYLQSSEITYESWRYDVWQLQTLAKLSYLETDQELPFNQYFEQIFFPQLYSDAQTAGVEFAYLIDALRISGENTGSISGYNSDAGLSQVQYSANAVSQLSRNHWLGGTIINPSLADRFGLLVTAQGADHESGRRTGSVAALLRLLTTDPNNEVALANLAADVNESLPMNYYDVVRLLLPTGGLLDMEPEAHARGISYLRDHWPAERWTAFAQQFPEIVATADTLLAQRQILDASKENFRALVDRYLAEYSESLDVFFEEHWEDAWDKIGLGSQPYYPLLVRYGQIWRFVSQGATGTNRAELFANASQLLHQHLMEEWQQNPNEAKRMLFADMAFNNPHFLAFLRESAADQSQIDALVFITRSLADIQEKADDFNRINLRLFGLTEEAGLGRNALLQIPLMVGVHGSLFERATEALENLEISDEPSRYLLTKYLALTLREISNVPLLAFNEEFPRITGVDEPYTYNATARHFVDLLQFINQDVPLMRDTTDFSRFRMIRAIFNGGNPEAQLANVGFYDSIIEELKTLYQKLDNGFYNSTDRADSVVLYNRSLFSSDDRTPTIHVPPEVDVHSVSIRNITQFTAEIVYPDGRVQVVPLVDSQLSIVATDGQNQLLTGIVTLQPGQSIHDLAEYVQELRSNVLPFSVEVERTLGSDFLDRPFFNNRYQIPELHLHYNKILTEKYYQQINELLQFDPSEARQGLRDNIDFYSSVIVPYFAYLVDTGILDPIDKLPTTLDQLNEYLADKGLSHLQLRDEGDYLPVGISDNLSSQVMSTYASTPREWLNLLQDYYRTSLNIPDLIRVLREQQEIEKYLQDIESLFPDVIVEFNYNKTRPVGVGSPEQADVFMSDIDIIVPDADFGVIEYLFRNPAPVSLTPAQITISVSDSDSDSISNSDYAQRQQSYFFQIHNWQNSGEAMALPNVALMMENFRRNNYENKRVTIDCEILREKEPFCIVVIRYDALEELAGENFEVIAGPSGLTINSTSGVRLDNAENFSQIVFRANDERMNLTFAYIPIETSNLEPGQVLTPNNWFDALNDTLDSLRQFFQMNKENDFFTEVRGTAFVIFRNFEFSSTVVISSPEGENSGQRLQLSQDPEGGASIITSPDGAVVLEGLERIGTTSVVLDDERIFLE